MNIILDTHYFLWSISKPDKIRSDLQVVIQTQANTVFVSSISIAEIMIKSSIGKLKIDFDPVAAAKESGFDFLDFSSQDALLLKELPFFHRDPFDRMLICQGISRNYHILSSDGKFASYSCRLLQ